MKNQPKSKNEEMAFSTQIAQIEPNFQKLQSKSVYNSFER